MQDINEALGKGHRFIVAPDNLGYGPHMVILSDFHYWSESYEELVEWCKHNNGQISGMTVDFDCESDLMMFILRWS